MYDENVKNIDFTYDEVQILQELLICRLDHCTSVGEELTVRELLDKLR